MKFKYYVLGFVVCSEIKGEFLYWNTGSRLSNLTVITEFADDAILDFTWTFQNDCTILNMNFHNQYDFAGSHILIGQSTHSIILFGNEQLSVLQTLYIPERLRPDNVQII